jgi:hypothetical protein
MGATIELAEPLALARGDADPFLLGLKDDDAVADLDPGSRSEIGLDDRCSANGSAVGAVEVVEKISVFLNDDLTMSSRDRGIRQDEITRVMGADEHMGALDGDLLPAVWTLNDDQLVSVRDESLAAVVDGDVGSAKPTAPLRDIISCHVGESVTELRGSV